MTLEPVECGFCQTISPPSLGDCPTCGTVLPILPGGIPWENRRVHGFATAFWLTIKEALRFPGAFFARLKGGYSHSGAILLVALLGFFSNLIQAIWLLVLTPHEARENFNELINTVLPGIFSPEMLDNLYRYSLVGQVLLAPLVAVVSLYLQAFVIWLILRVTGNRGGRFSLIMMIIALAQISNLAVIIPSLGHLISLGLGIFLLVFGLSIRLRISRGRAVFLVLAPFVAILLFFILINMVFNPGFLPINS